MLYLHGQDVKSEVGKHCYVFLVPFLVPLRFIAGDAWIVGVEQERTRGVLAVEDGGSFVEVEELAPFSIFTEAEIFEIGADPGFVVGVESMLVPEFVLSVGKCTLP